MSYVSMYTNMLISSPFSLNVQTKTTTVTANCSAIQHTATRCDTLQHTATTAIHCNTLHRVATHCNTLQDTARYCKASPS